MEASSLGLYFNMMPVLIALLIGAAGAQQVFRAPLDSDGTASLAWSVDYPAGQIQVEAHAAMSPSSWFALGFSDYGEFYPADYCVFWVDWKGETYLEDTWVNDDGRIVTDDSQDCNGFKYLRRHNTTKFTFTRKFDTCDEMDYVIEEGTTHIVWLEGRGPLFRLSGVNVNDATKQGMERVQLLKNLNPVAEHPPGTWSHDVLAQSVRVPDNDTTYWCHVHRLPSALAKKHHVVQYEAIIQKGNEHLVHHMEVFHCETRKDEEMPSYRGPCFAPGRPQATMVCQRVLAAWAMGAPPFVYPSEAGLPIGGPEYNPYVMLEVHYNNPERRADWVDSSGVRLYISPTLRRYDGGVIELGLEYTDKMAIPPRQPKFELSGYCITECTAVGLPPEGIVIFGSQLHTHLTGIRVFTRHFRDGRELPELNRDNHYSTHFQEIRLLKRPVRVLPGDALITTCWYRTLDRDNITLGGHAISDEMCVNYVHYYPKVDLEVCKSSISTESLRTYFRFLNEWEGQETSTEKGVSDNYKSVKWTPVRSQVLNELYRESPLSMQCNQSSGERFPGYWENMPTTPVMYSLPPEPRMCDFED